MRLKSISTSNFGKLANEKISFSKGLTVVKGPNEAGKSFSIEAITLGLYGDASSGAAQIREHCRKWGSEGSFSLELEIESAGETYRVIRDFENKQNILVKPGGTEIKDKETVRKQVADLVGLPSELAFKATACIPQEEVEEIKNAVSPLREIIEGRLAGSGTDTNKIVKKINKAKESILSRRGNKGELVSVDSLIHSTEQDLSIKRDRLSELAGNKRELEKVKQKLQKDDQDLKDKEKAYKGSTEYISAKERFEKADKEFDSVQEDTDKYKGATKKIQSATKELDKLKPKLDSLSLIIEKGEEYLKANESCEELEKERSELNRKISNIKKIGTQIKNKQKEIDFYKKVDYAVLQNVREIPGEIKGLRSSLAEQLFGIKVDLEKDIEFSIIADRKKVNGLSAEMHEEAIVRFPGIASVQIRNLTGEEMPIVEEIKRKEDVLDQQFKKYGVKSIDELEDLYKKRENAITEKRALEVKAEAVLGGDDLENLQDKLKGLEQEFKKENAYKEKLKTFAVTPVELKKKNEEKARLETRKYELEDIIKQNNWILDAIGDDEDELNNRKKSALKEVTKAEDRLANLKIYECSPEDFAKLERETEALKKIVEELNNKQIELNVKISQETIGAEDIAELEERLSALKKKRERLDHKYRLLDIINENITWARESSISRFSEGIEDRMSKILSKITDGKYKKVRMDENLGVSVFSSEKEEFIKVDDKIDRLSGGTVDQIYLAARLAILGLIATEEKPPLILDDTFVSFDDMGRKDRAFKILESVAKDSQILYFTCHGCPENLNVVELK